MASCDDYELLEQIGRGSFGKVYRARHIDGDIRAIKVIELDSNHDDDIESVQQEISMLQTCNCPHLIRYHGSCAAGSTLWIIMELLNGSLQEVMRETESTIDEATIAWIMKDLLQALVYIHTERMIHRDIKAANVLIASDGTIRLADFGVSVKLTSSIDKRQTFVGSPYWMAPEVISQAQYDFKADIWSLGITAIELALGRPPFHEKHPMQAVMLIPKRPPPTLPPDKNFGKKFQSFIESCCVMDPLARPSAPELLKHPFIKGATRQTSKLVELLETRRAAMVMKGLFAAEGDQSDAASAARRVGGPGGVINNEDQSWIFDETFHPHSSLAASLASPPPLHHHHHSSRMTSAIFGNLTTLPGDGFSLGLGTEEGSAVLGQAQLIQSSASTDVYGNNTSKNSVLPTSSSSLRALVHESGDIPQTNTSTVANTPPCGSPNSDEGSVFSDTKMGTKSLFSSSEDLLETRVRALSASPPSMSLRRLNLARTANVVGDTSAAEAVAPGGGGGRSPGAPPGPPRRNSIFNRVSLHRDSGGGKTDEKVSAAAAKDALETVRKQQEAAILRSRRRASVQSGLGSAIEDSDVLAAQAAAEIGAAMAQAEKTKRKKLLKQIAKRAKREDKELSVVDKALFGLPPSPNIAVVNSLSVGSVSTPPTSPDGIVRPKSPAPLPQPRSRDSSSGTFVASPTGPKEQDDFDKLSDYFHDYLTRPLLALWDKAEEGSEEQAALENLCLSLQRVDLVGSTSNGSPVPNAQSGRLTKLLLQLLKVPDAPV